MAQPETAPWAHRSGEAEAAVLRRFVGRYRWFPGTLLARTVAPAGQVVDGVAVDASTPFHYWWQAHLLDALVDSAWRRHRTDDLAGARRTAHTAHRLLVTIRLRNRGTLRNHFYDDMAWLALAVERLAVLDGSLGLRAARRSLTPARRTLSRELRQAHDDAGGVVWNRDRLFLNAATAGPVALHLARTGARAQARTVVEWVFRHLLDPGRGLIRDGVRRDGELVPTLYTYNQGPVLAALLALGGPQDIERAGQLVHAVADHLVTGDRSSRVLITHGAGDGGLFTGILSRYLGAAAGDSRLPDSVRDEAAGLVLATAESLWRARSAPLGLFPGTAMEPAVPPASGDPVELSTQLQAWTVFEAAARLDG